MALISIPYCEECGEAPVPHRLEKFSQTLDDLMFRADPTRGFFNFFETKVTENIIRLIPIGLVAGLLDGLASLHVVKKSTVARKGDNTRTLALYEGALEKNVQLTQYFFFGVPLGFVAEKMDGSKRKVVFTVIPRPHNFISPSLAWMDDKGILKKKMAEGNIPHADGGVARTFKEALTIFKRLNAPVIIKPHRGSRGRHTTLDIRTEEELKRAFKIGMQITTAVVIEKYLHGTVHRLSLIHI